ncbi:MAG: sel1 repeat family protein [Clostridiales Family XIII bacterium]|jgi:TPR repeat protein|nr:sel1 repeat family protein [Clostridiales Family XIII bacterium]
MDKYQYKLLMELAAYGDTQAMAELTEFLCMQKDSDLFPEQKAMVFDYLLKLADDENPRAMLQLGVIFYNGTMGQEQNYTEARKWYERAANGGDDWAQCNLGYFYYYGREVEVDYEIAYDYFTKSAYQNNPNALYKLGDLHYHGKYVKQDFDAAFYWYERARSFAIDYNGQGGSNVSEVFPNICHRLGLCYLNGRGIEVDLLQALNLFQIAERNFYFWTMREHPFAAATLRETQRQLRIVRRKLNTTIPRDKLAYRNDKIIPLFIDESSHLI